VPLSSSSVLRRLNLSNTKIKTLNYQDQAMLEEIDISGCNELEVIKLSNCPKLRSLSVPGSVREVNISNCENLESIYAPYTGSSLRTSNLETVIVATCPKLKSINLANQNN